MRKSSSVLMTRVSVAVLALLGSPILQGRTHASGPSANFVPPPPGTPSLTGSLDWRFSEPGSAVGASGLVAADIDGDGTGEIVATAQFANYPYEYGWYVLSHDASGYGQEWVSPTYREPIGALVVANVDSDPALEVLVAVGSRVLVYDGATHALERTIAGLRYGTKAMAVADVDGDGQLELVSTDGTDLYFQDIATGNVEYHGIGLGGTALAIGNVCGNSGLEVVVANGSATGYVIGARQRRVVWVRPDGFGDHVAIADVDRDGVNDIVSAFRSGPAAGIAVFDATAKTQKAGLSAYVSALAVVDTDGDGWPEVIYAGQNQVGTGVIEVLDGRTLGLLWRASSTSVAVTALAWGNTDADPAGELVYGAIYSDALGIIDGATHALEWASTDIVGPFAVAFGDVDADGRMETVSLSWSSYASYQTGRWQVHDANTHLLEYESDPVGSYAVLPRLLVANVDGDPQAEVIVPAGGYPGDVLICYDGLTHAEQWRRSLAPTTDSTQRLTALAIGDVDGDGALEVVASAWNYVGGASVFVLDAATGAIEWQSFSLGPYGDLAFVRLARLGGSHPSIVVRQASSSFSMTDARLSVVDAVAHTATTVAVPFLSALDVADLDGNGTDEVIAGTGDGRLVVLDPATGAITRTIASYGQRIDGLAARDLDGDGVVDFAFALADAVYVVSGVDGHALWTSEPLDDGSPSIDVAREDGLVVTAPTVKGRFKIGVSISSSGFAVFVLRPPSSP